MGTLWKVLTRKKVIDSSEETRLNRVLNTFDLTALGVGSTLGVGVYVLAGQVAKDTAGPSVVLSFLIAALASVFAGLCYAEFGARVPKAGSAYIYSYVCVGEFVAFVIGWNLILEYVIGAASVGKGLSLYLDRLLNNTMKDAFIDITPIDVPYMSTYFDFFAFGISMLLSVALAFGMKESSIGNNIFTTLNIGMVLFVVIAGLFHVKAENWEVPANSTEPSIGYGGFFPFGVEGMIKGAAKCFYGFVGFDCIATAGEEVRNPKKAIPISIILSLSIIFLAYFGTSAVTTLMVPYYLQDKDTPLPHAFESVGWEWAKWVVAIGGIFGLCASLFGAMFPLPRIIFAMGSDGLVFRFLAKVHSRFQTPVVGTLLAGLLTGSMAALFDLDQLVSMMSIGTLLAYTIVAACVLLLRCSIDKDDMKRYVRVRTTSDTDESSENDNDNNDNLYTESRKFSVNADDEATTSDSNQLLTNESTNSTICSQIFNIRKQKNPSKLSENVVAVEVFLYCVLCVVVGLCIVYLKEKIGDGEIWAIVLTSVVVAITLIVLISLAMQPTSKQVLTFKVPWVPLIPALSIFVNIYLMLMLDAPTWVRFGVWMALGVPMYYYCMRHNFVQTTNTYSKNNSLAVTSDDKPQANGHLNLAYVYNNNNNNEVQKKSPTPQKDIEKQQEDIIAQLDEFLDNEAVKISRKLSDVSLVSSGVVSRAENVVADVHRGSYDDVLVPYPVLSSFAPVGPASESTAIKNDGNSDDSVKTSDGEQNKSRRYSSRVEDFDKIEVVNSDEKHDETKCDNMTDNEYYGVSDNIYSEIADNNEDKPEAQHPNMSNGIDSKGDPPPPNSEDTNEQSNKLETTQSLDEISLKPPANNLLLTSNYNELPPIPPPLPTPDYSTAPTTPTSIFNFPRPTVSHLQSVTLRKVDTNKRNAEKTGVDLPEGNLKVGSEESKPFFEKLNSVLQKMPATIQSFLPVGNKNREVKEDVKVDGYVLEEHINTDKAKEKFEEYVQERIKNPQPSLEELKRSRLSSPTRRTFEHSVEESDDDFEKHRKQMSKVFMSMNLKKKESTKRNREDNARWNSLGATPLPADDKRVHREKMQDIFKSIQLIRKESTQRADENDKKTM